MKPLSAFPLLVPLLAACPGPATPTQAPVAASSASPSQAASSVQGAPSAPPPPSASADPGALVITGSCFKKQELQCLETPVGIEKSGCEMMGGTALSGPCPTKDRLGTCRQLVQGVETAATHYYKGFTMASDLKAFCEAHSGTRQYVPAP